MVRTCYEISDKISAYFGTILGEDMPKENPASIFINKGLMEGNMISGKRRFHRSTLYASYSFAQ
jgi:hypothetical protein